MNTSRFHSSYRPSPMPNDPRGTEAWALTESARRIAFGQTADDFPESLLAAVRLNWRLWTFFQAGVSGSDCTLPADIRRNMLSMCSFVDKTTVDILANPKADKAEILITINRNIANGLFAGLQPRADADMDAADADVLSITPIPPQSSHQAIRTSA